MTMAHHIKITEKIFLILIVIVAFIQFTQWGFQTLKQLLSLFFQTSFAEATFLSPIIGFIAVGGSIMLILGSLLRWKGGPSAKWYFSLGFLLFAFKSIFVIINEILLTKQITDKVTENHINNLASNISNELLLVVLWLGLLVYFSKKYEEKKPIQNTNIKTSLPVKEVPDDKN